jgi:hypothetical protein
VESRYGFEGIIMAYLKVLYQDVCGKTKENHKTLSIPVIF